MDGHAVPAHPDRQGHAESRNQRFPIEELARHQVLGQRSCGIARQLVDPPHADMIAKVFGVLEDPFDDGSPSILPKGCPRHRATGIHDGQSRRG